ncbi:MAG TPA: lactate utilization protein [Verrucomicrobiae bacterium]|nr:lactate utilization protein [Verrucomicrobiae bacterium]
MNEREKILGRIREALKRPAHVPGAHGMAPLPASAHSSAAGARQWLPKVGDSIEEQFALFAKNAAELKADFQLLNSAEAMRQALVRLCKAERWERVAGHSGELTNAICQPLKVPMLHTDKVYDIHALEACSAGISECDALVAQTGSVLVTSRSAGGRALSVLPPHHVVLARREQLVADLPAAFELLKQKHADHYPSMISFITGPSRTGDIERILVLGAHGPKKLTILCF